MATFNWELYFIMPEADVGITGLQNWSTEYK